MWVKKPAVSNEEKLKPCSNCQSLSFEVRFAINKDGKDCYPYFCTICNNRSPILVGKEYAYSLGFKPYDK
jgi:hypothetical protein